MTNDKPCGRQDPHIPHFWHTPAAGLLSVGRVCCPGVEDPALAGLSEDQLKLAARELKRRQAAAEKLQQDEKFRRHQLRQAELARSFGSGLVDYLAEAGWTPPAAWDEAAQVKILGQIYDLMLDYREEQDRIA